MRIKDGLKFKDNVHLELFDKDGKLITERWGHNVITTVGLTHIADQLGASPSEATMGWMAVGTSNTAAAAGDTTLGAEVAASRTALTSRTHSGAVVTYVCTFGVGVGTGGLYEAGIFNASSSGIMLCRLTYAIINKGASDTLQITWTVTAGDDGV